MLTLEKRKPGTIAKVFNTHPMTEDRVAKIAFIKSRAHQIGRQSNRSRALDDKPAAPSLELHHRNRILFKADGASGKAWSQNFVEWIGSHLCI